ncbi:hypothetical protein ACFVUS_26445 [Nocardia sp. NPDC058058]
MTAFDPIGRWPNPQHTIDIAKYSVESACSHGYLLEIAQLIGRRKRFARE